MKRDLYGYIAFGSDELYHRGALFSALRLLHYCPDADIRILTDRPYFFKGYPIEISTILPQEMAEMSFGGQYHFGIKAAGAIALLNQCERLFLMDTDMYPVGDMSACFKLISPFSSIMFRREGRPDQEYRALLGQNILVGGQILTGTETMWASGVLGVHRDNLPALQDAYAAIRQVFDVTGKHTPEQFCVGIALSQGERTITPQRLPLRNYNTRGKKFFARKRIAEFFEQNAHLSVGQQIENAAGHRVHRTALDLWEQRQMWSFGWADRLLRVRR